VGLWKIGIDSKEFVALQINVVSQKLGNIDFD
jgi:hypothetical protein